MKIANFEQTTKKNDANYIFFCAFFLFEEKIHLMNNNIATCFAIVKSYYFTHSIALYYRNKIMYRQLIIEFSPQFKQKSNISFVNLAGSLD